MDPAGEPGDSELVTRAQRGDRDAFGMLVRRHEGLAVRIATVVCGSAGAEDAAQDAFVRAYRSLDRFDPDRPFRPWLARIVTNTAKNHVRSEQRHVQLAVRSTCETSTPDAGPAAAIATENHARLALALERLSEADRLILACRWFEDMNEHEIAVVLGVRRGTVKSRLSRAMARLRDDFTSTEVAYD
jgi:RNA polymerase sigma factor (sigma-70 family)